MNSNASRPTPRANTGSVLRNFISRHGDDADAAGAALRSVLRPAFDAVLRDPLARLPPR